MDTNVAVKQPKKPRQNRTQTVKLRRDVAVAIGKLANQRQLQTEALVNEILEQHLQIHLRPTPSRGSDFLLSVSGIFNSGIENTSENVHSIVSDFVLQKYHGQSAL